MKKVFHPYLLCVVLLAALMSTSIQSAQAQSSFTHEGHLVYTQVEQMPEFPGGRSAMHEYLKSNIKYPAAAKKNKVSGKVYISFIVNETGKVTGAIVKRGPGSGCNEEALRVVNAMPAWIPGKHNGEAVRVQYTLPISFELTPASK